MGAGSTCGVSGDQDHHSSRARLASWSPRDRLADRARGLVIGVRNHARLVTLQPMRESRWAVLPVALAFAASGVALAGCGSEAATSPDTTTEEAQSRAVMSFQPPVQPGIESLTDCAQLQAVFDQAVENYKRVAVAAAYKEAAKQRMREIDCDG